MTKNWQKTVKLCWLVWGFKKLNLLGKPWWIMSENKKNTILRGIFSAEVPDKSGEVVSIKGMDLSTIEEGRGLVNSEHDNSFTKTVGKILNAKKIFKEADCIDEFEKRAFKSVNGAALLVGNIELFDGPEAHDEARAIAKIAKYSQRKNEPLMLGFSVEGGILERTDSTIKRSIVRKVAITSGPCNEAARAELATELTKSEYAIYEKLSKTEKSKETLTNGQVLEVYDEERINQSLNSIKTRLGGLVKALEAGFGGATASLTQGAALQKQNLKGVKPSTKIIGEETTLPGEETTKEAKVETSGLHEIDENKADKIDDKKEDAKIKFKLKKAEFIAYSFYNSLKK